MKRKNEKMKYEKKKKRRSQWRADLGINRG